MNFSDRLRELRTNAGLTQKELANRCQIAQSCIAMLEKGRSEASVSTLMTLSNEFEVSIEYLLGLEDDFGGRVAQKEAPQFTAEERELLEDYRELSAPGKQLVQTTVKTLLNNSEVKNRSNKRKI